MELRSLECPKDEAKDEKSIGDLLLKFMNYTTAHGIGRLAESKTIAWKLFWTVVCLGTFSMFVYQVHGLFLLYLSRPVSTSVKITFEKEMSFPAVTICNLNMIRSDSIPHAVKQALRNHMQYGKSSTSQKRSRQFTAKNDSSTDDDHYGDEDYPDVDKVNTRRKARKEVFRAIIANLKFGNMYRHGHLFPKLIVQCTWKEVNCKSRKFWKRSWSNTYGNCYTFNSGSVRVNNLPVGILKSTKSGPSNGLFLHLNIEQDKYIGPMTREAGARVVLHVQGSVPFPDEEGFSVAPGMATSVGLKKTQILRLDRFGNQSCLIIDELSEQNIYRKFKNVTHYSQQLDAKVTAKMNEMQRHNMSWIEVQFLKKAVKVLSMCRNTLKYTYVFAFYLNKNNQSVIFEDNQKDVEMATETLSEYLERDISSENLGCIKQKVQDKYRYCEMRRKVLLDHVSEGYEKDFWDFEDIP